MEIKFVNLEPAFNGIRGWITVSELDTITGGNKMQAKHQRGEMITHSFKSGQKVRDCYRRS